MRRLARRSLLLLVATAVAALGAASAQEQGEEAFQQMRELLARGYYNSAAQLEGPNLVENHPDDPEARFLYARALYHGGAVGAARLELDRAFALADDPPVTYRHLDGLLRAAEGEAEAAIELLEGVFDTSDAYEHAMDWARVAWQFGRTDVALRAYRSAAETERGRREPWPHLGRGRILAFTGELEDAVAAFERTIEVYEDESAADTGLPSPAYVEAFYRLGRVFERMGDFERADVNYRAAQSVDPNFQPAVDALEALDDRNE